MAKANKPRKHAKVSNIKKSSEKPLLCDENGEPVSSENDPDILPPPEEELLTTPPYEPPPPAEGP